MNNKKITIMFIITATILLLGIVGFTIAYFTSSVDFENEFTTGKYETTATETFISPENWLPGDTTPKTLTIENTGDVDVKARVCITEEWVSSSGYPLDNAVYGEKVAILNLINTNDWTKKGSCYVYNDTLEPDDVTSSFIESVTFNPNIEANIECEPTTGNGTITQTCTSNENGYDNATYTLTFKVETVQANAENTIWTEQTKYLANDYRLYDTIPTGIDMYDSFEEAISYFDNRPFCLKYKVYGNGISENFLEFKISEEMAQYNPGLTIGSYTIKGGIDESNLDDKPIYEANKQVLFDAFGSSKCEIYSDSIFCYAPNYTGLHVSASNTGLLSITENSDWYCAINNENSVLFTVCGM